MSRFGRQRADFYPFVIHAAVIVQLIQGSQVNRQEWVRLEVAATNETSAAVLSSTSRSMSEGEARGIGGIFPPDSFAACTAFC